jgi:alkylhydroperoxidase family enzyme
MESSTSTAAPFLAPVDKPPGFLWKLSYYFMRKKFGKVMTPASVFSVRMPFAFTSFYAKIGKLDKKLDLPADLVALVREQVASVNQCHFCMDTNKAAAMEKAKDSLAKIEALGAYRTSPLFGHAERVALDYATELTTTKAVSRATVEELKRHYNDRQVCDLVWLVSSEHLYNINNIGLNIGSDGFCQTLTRK